MSLVPDVTCLEAGKRGSDVCLDAFTVTILYVLTCHEDHTYNLTMRAVQSEIALNQLKCSDLGIKAIMAVRSAMV